jgi:threonine dehydratase
VHAVSLWNPGSPSDRTFVTPRAPTREALAGDTDGAHDSAVRAPLGPIALEEIEAARARIGSEVVRTPLICIVSEEPVQVWAKLENLQPIGSFKLRGAGNAMALADPATLAGGVYTASAGNMAQGVAWNARRRGIPCTVIVPDHAPAAKLEAVERLGTRIVKVPFKRWWQVLANHGHPDFEGLFIHPFADPTVMAGNGTIGLEIVEEAPQVDAVIVPWGGGGLSVGIASAVKAMRPEARVFAAEMETAAPFAASLAAGRPVTIDYTPSWVDGIGGASVLDEIWPLASSLLDGSITVSLQQVADAVRRLASHGVVAEGGGAASVAAALTGKAGVSGVVAVVSGGNIDPHVLAKILAGETP